MRKPYILIIELIPRDCWLECIILICDLFALAPKHWDPNPAKNYDIGVENIKSLINILKN